MECIECYSEKDHITPLLNPKNCLGKHLQYVCGTCGRCLCINKDEKHRQRWNFPFKSLDIAKLYLRAADFTNKKPCGIYEILNSQGRKSYKIFVTIEDLEIYLHKNKDKSCPMVQAVYIKECYQEFSNTKVKFLDIREVEQYLLIQ